MNVIKRIFSGCLVMVMLHVVFLDAAFASKAKKIRKITKSTPSVIVTPPEPIPVEVVQGGQSWIGKNKWWLLLGVAAAGGAAAAAGGGGGGGDDGGSNDGSTDGSNAGSVIVSWE